MSDAVIEVEKLSKCYLLAHQGSANGGFRYQRFSDVLINAAKAPFRLLQKGPQPSANREEFWALRDVSFEIKRGEVVGIVGRNGAGKSTLLKILSRITEPTSGRIEIDGRVASLLEVGTGFHPELTGRENIYLNGAILGMARREITRKFDEIVAFAEVEKFLDTPVRFYSSGMYVRLAFAVAAHLEPEILIVDEVLAVGDAQFQKKCLGKMQDVSTREGRTVIFVSHNMAAVSELCGRCLLLDRGGVKLDGSPSAVMREYLSGSDVNQAEKKWEAANAPGSDLIKLRLVRIAQPSDVANANPDMGEPVNIEIETEIFRPISELSISIKILSAEGRILLHAFDVIARESLTVGRHLHTCTLPPHMLNEGSYLLDVAASIPHVQVLFVLNQVLGWTVSDITPEASRYANEGGIIGPRLARWGFKNIAQDAGGFPNQIS